MRCPFCSTQDTAVKDSRTTDDQVRRRRFCNKCGSRFTTYERIELRSIYVMKKNGERLPFDFEKLKKSIRSALHKRAAHHDIDKFVSGILREIETSGENTISTKKIGEKVLEKLLFVDPVAYVRFASIYLEFDSIEDFVKLIHSIKEKMETEERL